MDKTVREHIQALEQKRNELSRQVMDESNAGRRNELETELSGSPVHATFLSRCA